MKQTRIWMLQVGIFVAVLSAPLVKAQEVEIIGSIGKEIFESLGSDAAEFGGEAVAKQTAERLVTEATESAGREGGRIAEAQVGRIVAAGKETLVFDLKQISGKSLPLLEDLGDEALPAAVTTLARPGVENGIESLGTIALKKAALAGETRLPGAGLKVVEHFGEDGASIVGDLSEDQANSLVGGLHPQEINSLSGSERSSLLKALASRPDATLRNLNDLTKPLIVIAAGTVIWHGEDLALGPDEKVTELPNGTVVREKTGVVSRALSLGPALAHEISVPLKWPGIIVSLGLVAVLICLLWHRLRRVRRNVRATVP